MSKKIEVSVGQWVFIGEQKSRVSGLVMAVHPEHIKVGYSQNRSKAIKEDVVWHDGYWKFLTLTFSMYGYIKINYFRAFVLTVWKNTSFLT